MAFIQSLPLASRSAILPPSSTSKWTGAAVATRTDSKNVTTISNAPANIIMPGWNMSSSRGGSSGDAWKRLRIAAAAGAIGAALTLLPSTEANAAIFHFRGTRPTDLGVQYGRYLNSCPTTPNCVSSSANVYDSHYVPSWTYNNETSKQPKKAMSEAVGDLKKVLSEYPNVEIIESKPIKTDFGEGYYVYAEFESKLMGYIDDVEFYFRPDSDSSSTVEYRTASRLGEGDFGANRNRIRDLRVALQEIDSRWASTGY